MKFLGINRLRSSNSGAVAVIYALCFLMVIGATGLAVDVARLYAVRSALQSTVDIALLGAMKSIREIPDVQSEFERLFHANYPRARNGYDAGYMGSIVMEMHVTANTSSEEEEATGISSTTGEYTAEVRVSVPNVFMTIFNRNYESVTATASAINNTEEIQKKAYVTFVLDATGSMCLPDCTAMEALKAATREGIEILSDGKPTLENIWVTIIPYDTTVAFDSVRNPGAINWVRAPWDQRATWHLAWANKVFLANRNPDKPADPAYDDTSEALPTTDTTKFRTPQQQRVEPVPFVPGIGNVNPYWGNDLESWHHQSAIFLEQDKAALLSVTNGINAGLWTRINVGLGWGFRGMLRSWEHLLKPGGGPPILPHNFSETERGYVVLMTDGENSVYLGQEGTASDDNAATLALCNATKAKGIKLIVIGLGASINTTLLTSCASADSYYHAPTPAALRPIFQSLAVLIVQELGLRLTR